jgi:hypothetical protein
MRASEIAVRIGMAGLKRAGHKGPIAALEQFGKLLQS